MENVNCNTEGVGISTYLTIDSMAGGQENVSIRSDSVMRKPTMMKAMTIIPGVKAILHELDLKYSVENVPSNAENLNKTPTVKALTLLKDLPFKERNRVEGKRLLPPHIKVPPKKIFGYPERYRSPTDAMVSPISRGLLARNRRPARTLAPVVPPKALENTFEDVQDVEIEGVERISE